MIKTYAFQMCSDATQDAFRETPTDSTGDEIPAALQGRDPNTPVMMYCTGGIRCDIYSAYLRKKGFRCSGPGAHRPVRH